MGGRADALGGGGHFVGILLQVLDELGDARCFEVLWIDDQCVRHVGHDDHGLEFGRIETKVGIKILVDHQRRWRRGKQCVAVGSRMIDEFGADVSGRSGAVLDDDRLAPFARQPVSNKSRDRIGRPAGGKRHNDFNRPIRIILRARRSEGHYQ